MKTGDRIIKIDGAAVKNADEMSGALNAGPGKKVITFLRGKQEQQVTVDFDEAPASRPESRAAR
jgi:C-terminal processing protease CtpA/Prc